MRLPVAVLLLSGCIATAATPLDGASDPAPASPAAEAWWTMETEGASDGASLAGFLWTVPDGAAVPSAWWDDVEVVVLEVAPVVLDVAPTTWGLDAFAEGDDGLRHVGSLVEAPGLATWEDPIAGSGRQEIEPEFEPRFLWLFGLDDGDALHLALAADVPAGASFRVAFRVLPEDPGFERDPAASTEQFLAEREGEATALAATGRGVGHMHALYVAGDGLGRYEFRQGDVEVERHDTLAPEAVASAKTVRTSFDAPRGWSWVVGGRIADAGVVEWTAAGDVHGATFATDGVTANAPFAGNVGWLVAGDPFFAAVGEGDGGSAVEFTTRTTGLDGVVLVRHTSFGATLEDLFGTPSESRQWTWEGLVPLHLATHRGDLVAATPSGPVVVLPGAGAR